MNTAPDLLAWTTSPVKRQSHYCVYDLPTDDPDSDDYGIDIERHMENTYALEKLDRTGELVSILRDELVQFDPERYSARSIYFKYELFNGVLLRFENCDEADADGYFCIESLTIEQRYLLHAKKQAFLEKLLSIKNTKEAAKERRRKILELYPSFTFGKEKE